jgi:Leucine-rich repeat (LRR) protein
LQHGKLEYLYLFGNGLYGELPRNVSAANLVELDLSMNRLTREIPEAFRDLKKLTLMFLYKNQLTGSIPEWVFQHEKLEYLCGSAWTTTVSRATYRATSGRST